LQINKIKTYPNHESDAILAEKFMTKDTLCLVFLAIWEAEIGRMVVRAQPQANSETRYAK
jgi:hypothetical protein